METTINNRLHSITADDWNENNVSFKTMEAIREALSEKELAGPTGLQHITCSCFKLNGKSETMNGDIAVWVDILFRTGDRFSGCGLLEAKAKKHSSGNYDELERKPNKSTQKAQLEYIKENTRYPQLLMYASERIVSDHMRNNAVPRLIEMLEASSRVDIKSPYPVIILPESTEPRHPTAYVGTHAAVLQLPTAFQVRQRSKTPEQLERMSGTLSALICQRYIQGYDLDVEPETIARLTDCKEVARPAAYLLRIAIGHGGYPPPEPKVPISDQQWQQLSSEERA